MADNLTFPENLKYTKDHEWAKTEGNVVTVGVSGYATSQLGDIVYVELPEVGAEVTKGQSFGVVESTKAVSEVFAPVSGKVVARNEALIDTPDALNADPYEKGWMIQVEATEGGDLAGLMDHPAYLKHVAESAH